MATQNGSGNGKDLHAQLDLLTSRDDASRSGSANGYGPDGPGDPDGSGDPGGNGAATNAGPAESESGAQSAEGNGSPVVADQSVYDESKVKTLSSLEHIRLRTGMYIGRLGNGDDPEDGIYVLLKEVIDNAVDEFIMGHGRKIDVDIEDNRVRVRDFGRGIPLGKVVECTSIINTGAKYNDEVFQFSVGLNGVGAKAVNALSADFRVAAYRNGRFAEATYEQGRLLHQREGDTDEPDGTCVEFLPDREIFGAYAFQPDYVERRMWNYAYLNSGLRLICNKKRFVSRHGLLDFLKAETGEHVLYEPAYHKSQYIEFSFTHTTNYGETLFSFVNGQYTADGGSHQSAFREGILKGVNEYFKKSYGGSGCAGVHRGGHRHQAQSEPIFESQTKNKLGNTEIRGWLVSEIRSAVVDFLHKNQESAQKIQDKITQNERLRKELNAVKKEAREAARRIAIKIPNFKDCKYHYGHARHGEDSSIFITEGPSAAGSMVSARDPLTQAIFGLKGVPLNVFSRTRAAIYKNEELYNLMMALGIEDGHVQSAFQQGNHRDGRRLRRLPHTKPPDDLLPELLRRDLVLAGHVHILETPLFRVRNTKETVYCYSEKERNEALDRIRGAEVTRFKGWARSLPGNSASSSVPTCGS